MKINILSINPITVIPVIRYIVHFFIDSIKADVKLTEVHVKSFNNYYNNIEHFKFDNIAEYDTYQAFRGQSASFKISKYFHIISKIFSIYLKKEQQLIYTNDYQVLFFVLWIKQLFAKKVILIYQQFELVELERLNKINHLFYASVLKKANLVDLTIFSEINRLNYYTNQSTLAKKNAFVLPNSCEAPMPIENNQKHSLFNSFAADSFIIAHLGNVGGEQHYFKNFIKAAEQLKDHKKIIFLFLGRKNELINKTIKEKALPNLFFMDPVPHEELAQIYPFIDLGVILYKGTSPNYEFCAPNKLYELWANGVPVIGHQLKGLIPLFDRKEKGILTNFDDVEKIGNTIITYSKEKRDKLTLMQIFKEELSVNIHFQLLEKKIESLLKLSL